MTPIFVSLREKERMYIDLYGFLSEQHNAVMLEIRMWLAVAEAREVDMREIKEVLA